MRKVGQIALNTFRESVRDKVLYVIVFVSLLMVVSSKALGWVSVGEEMQVMEHFSLAIVSLFGALIGVFVGTGLIYKEIDKRTIYTILSKPVHRWQFLVGKFLGLQAVLGCIVLGMGVANTLFLYVASSGDGAQAVDWSMYWMALLLIFFELMIVTALAMLFSTLASPILAAFFTFCGYLIGQVTPSLMDLVQLKTGDMGSTYMKVEKLGTAVDQAHWLLKPLSLGMYYVLPNLTYFHLRNRVVYGPPVDHGRFFFDGEVGQAILYALCYSGAVLLVAVLLFDRKRF